MVLWLLKPNPPTDLFALVLPDRFEEFIAL